MKRGLKIALIMSVCFLGIQGMAFGQQSDNDRLLAAVRNNNTAETIRYLSGGYSVNPNYKFFEGTVEKNLLTKAIENQNLQIVQALVNKGAITDFGGIRTETPLIVAAKIGAADIVRYLISIGGNTNAQDTLGNTALHYAAGAGGRSSRGVITVLLQGGARDSSYIRNSNGETPFMVAVREAQPSIIETFVDSDRFDVTRRDDSGIPPILAAISMNIDLGTLEAMLQKSTLPPRDIMDNRNRNAYDYIRLYRNNNASFIRLLDRFQDLKG